MPSQIGQQHHQGQQQTSTEPEMRNEQTNKNEKKTPNRKIKLQWSVADFYNVRIPGNKPNIKPAV
eukprot:13614914-Ditylum_brightwellii.AAC.1